MKVHSMDKAMLQTTLTQAGFARLTPYIDQLARPSIRLHATPAAESDLKPGASKLGGLPDLSPSTPWPQWHGLPQSFVAQIQLADVVPYDSNKVLPPRGMLWFFYDAQQNTFGEGPDDRGGWQVLFSAGNLSSLRRTPAPARLPATSCFKSCALSFSNELTYTLQPPLEIPHLTWTDADQVQYDALLEKLSDPADRANPHHRMLGFPNTLQDDMRIQCQLAPLAITDPDDPRVPELTQHAQDWQLLLQVDSDAQAAMHWASVGMLYYWVKQADLQSRRFDQTWLVLQSE